MLLEFFLERSRIQAEGKGAGYVGYVPDLPEIRVTAASAAECREKLALAISRLLAGGEPPKAARDEQAVYEYLLSTPFDAEVPPEAGAAGNREVREAPQSSRQPYRDITYEKSDWVARVTINRPQFYNTYSSATLLEMARAFRDAAMDDRVAVLVLTGAGERAFCAGSDMNEHSREHLGHPDRFYRWMGLLIEAHRALRDLGKPTVARINGIVAGGGNEWSLACDLAIAADYATFLHLDTSVGLVAASGAAQWLPVVVGERRAREMLMTGEPVSASKAMLWGLVNNVVPYSELDAAVDALCHKLLAKFPDCTRYTRKQLGFWKEMAWNATIAQAREWLSLHFAGEEAREGLKALMEGREVDFRAFRERRAGKETGPRDCGHCGATGLPRLFDFCGHCGVKLK